MQAQPLGDIAGFKVAALAVEGHDCRHYLYFRQHFSRTTAEADADKVLFVAGLLPDWTERDVAQLFSAFGKVKSAAISALHSGPTARVAHVTFTTTKAMRAVLAGSKAFPPIQLPSQSVTGWMEQHKQWRTASQKLKDQVDAYVLGFDAAEEKAREALEAEKKRMDADGFTLVTTGKRGRQAGEEPVDKRKKKKRRELKNFYTFQMRESKRQQLADLRAKFEEDKAKIEKMKAARKFRPY